MRSYDSPNIGINVWFAMFNFEEQFRKEGISEDTDVTKVLSLIFDTRLLYFLNKDCNTVFNISQWLAGFKNVIGQFSNYEVEYSLPEF